MSDPSGEATSPPTIVIPIDQGEELFNEEGRAESKRFIDIVSRTLAADRGVLVLLTMRTDSFPQVQNDTVLAALPKDTFTLDKLLEGSYRDIIEGPAALVKPTPLKIDPQLTEALLQDAAGQDALALLAFTLGYLYDKYQANNELSLEGYKKLGRLKGVIETTVKQAIAEGVAKGELPKDEKAQLALIRTAFIPHLARVNSEGQFVRRIAAQTGIPPEARPLIKRLAEARLLIMDRRTVGGEEADVVEVAHEALLREWKDLNDSLVDEREFLVAKGQLEQDVLDYNETPEKRKKGALLGGNKLARAREWLIKRAQDLTADERQFIQASADAEQEEQERRVRAAEALAAANSRTAQRTLVAAAVFAAATLLSLGLYFAANKEKKLAEEQRNQAQIAESHFLAGQSTQETNTDNAVLGMLLALAALPDENGGVKRPYVGAAELALFSASQQRGEIAVLKGHHNGSTVRATFSPDGREVVTTSLDNTARIWDAMKGVQITVLKGHTAPVNCAVFSPDGARVVTASNDKTARIWDAGTGTQIAVLKGHERWVNCGEFSPDGSRVVTASSDETARIWDATTGAQIVLLKGHNQAVNSAAFSSNGKHVVTASSDKTARIWNAATSTQLGVLKGHDDVVNSAAFSPDGTRVATASSDGTARIWDATTGAQIVLLKGHGDAVNSVAFSRDGKRVAAVSSGNTARIFGTDTWSQIAVIKEPWGAAFSADAKSVVTASFGEAVQIWKTTREQNALLTGQGSEVKSAAFRRDGKRIVTASSDWDNAASIWDAATQERIAVLTGHDDRVRSATFSSDGRFVATASDDKTARVWDAATHGQIAVLTGHDDRVRSAAFSSDGRFVATASDDKTARLWNAVSGAQLVLLKGHDDKVNSAAFNSDGRFVVTASDDKTARLWNAVSGAQLVLLKGHDDKVNSAAFSPDGTRVATASSDGTVRIWDAITGALIISLRVHDTAASALFGVRVDEGQNGGEVMDAAFSPDGKRVVAAYSDKTARIWDIRGLTQIAVLRGHISDVLSAAFNADGTQVLTASKDGTARIWKVFPATQGLVNYARQIVPRCLTRQEREEVFLDPAPAAWCVEMAKWPNDTEEWKSWLAQKKTLLPVESAPRTSTVKAPKTEFANLPLVVSGGDTSNVKPTDNIDSVNDTFVALSLAGGGTRAAAFSYGVLEGLDETRVPPLRGAGSLLDQLKLLSGVSGGAILAGYYGLKKRQGFKDFRQRFLLQDPEEGIEIDLNSDNVKRGLQGGVNDLSAFSGWLDAHLFDQETLKRIYSKGRRPQVWINASDVYNRVAFVFAPLTFNALCSDLGSYPVSLAVAASTAVPVVFAPLVIKNFTGGCPLPLPHWVQEVRNDPGASPLLKIYANAFARYRSGEVRYVKLLDGGIVDNYGLASITIARLVSDTAYEPLAPEEAVKLRRLFFGVVDAGRGPSGSWVQTVEGPTGANLITAASDTATESGAVGSFSAFEDMMNTWQERLIKWRCGLSAADRHRYGAAAGWNCRDVRLFLTRLSFDDLGPERSAVLNAVETRFKLPPDQVDMLITAGHDVLLTNGVFRSFVGSLEPAD